MKSGTKAPPPKKKKKATLAKLKTQPNEASVTAFLNGIADEKRREDCFTVLALMRKITKAEPKMWGGSIVGFGNRRYRSASGREVDWFLTGFSPRKAALTLYLMASLEYLGSQRALLKTLGKHKTGGGCLYIRDLKDVDQRVLTTLIKDGISRLDKTFGKEAPAG
jgi:hypothetical protein